MINPLLWVLPVTAFSGAAVTSSLYVRAVRQNKQLRALSREADIALDAMTTPPYEKGVFSRLPLSSSDILSVYLNSRLMTQNAHRLLLLDCEPHDTAERASYAAVAERKHREVTRLIWAALIETFLSRVFSANLPLYGLQLLWTYGEEASVSENMSGLCSQR